MDNEVCKALDEIIEYAKNEKATRKSSERIIEVAENLKSQYSRVSMDEVELARVTLLELRGNLLGQMDGDFEKEGILELAKDREKILRKKLSSFDTESIERAKKSLGGCWSWLEHEED